MENASSMLVSIDAVSGETYFYYFILPFPLSSSKQFYDDNVDEDTEYQRK